MLIKLHLLKLQPLSRATTLNFAASKNPSSRATLTNAAFDFRIELYKEEIWSLHLQL